MKPYQNIMKKILRYVIFEGKVSVRQISHDLHLHKVMVEDILEYLKKNKYLINEDNSTNSCDGACPSGKLCESCPFASKTYGTYKGAYRVSEKAKEFISTG